MPLSFLFAALILLHLTFRHCVYLVKIMVQSGSVT
jgi:hypothetical protein